MADLIYIVGIGPGHPDYITPIAQKIIKEADILVGGERNLEIFQGLNKQVYIVKNNLKEIIEFIKQNYKNKKVVVIASGDPGMFGILNYFKYHFADEELEVIPGISSIQLAAAKTKVSWHDSILASIHGRDIEQVVELINSNSKVLVLTDDKNTPQVLGQRLLMRGTLDKTVYICSYLSYFQEEIISTTIDELANLSKEYIHCVVIFVDK